MKTIPPIVLVLLNVLASFDTVATAFILLPAQKNHGLTVVVHPFPTLLARKDEKGQEEETGATKEEGGGENGQQQQQQPGRGGEGGRGEGNKIHSSWEKRWDDKFEQLKAFQQKYGHTDVPTCLLDYHYLNIPLGSDSDEEELKKLSNWVYIQKENLKRGVMRKDRIERLATIGITPNRWPTTTTSTTRTNKDGNNKIPKTSTTTATTTKKKAKKVVETKTPMAEVAAVAVEKKNGVEPTATTTKVSAWEKRWDDMYGKLKAFQAKTGHTIVTFGDDLKLANWVQIQRENLKRGVMRKDRKDKLEEIGFVSTGSSSGSGGSG